MVEELLAICAKTKQSDKQVHVVCVLPKNCISSFSPRLERSPVYSSK